MKTGFGSYSFRWAFKAGMKLEAFLEQSASYGAKVVQLCENSGVERLDDQSLKNLAGLAHRLDLMLECGGRGGSRERLEAGIRRTARLEGRIYRCVLDTDGLARETVIANLRGLLPLLRDCGVILCAENHFRFSPGTLGGIVREVDDPAVAVCLDPLNSMAHWMGPEETIRELLPLARTAHVKDARMTQSGTSWVISGTALGEGHLNLAGYLAAVGPRVESLLLESWMEPVDGEAGPLTLATEALWARNGLALISEMSSRHHQTCQAPNPG